MLIDIYNEKYTNDLTSFYINYNFIIAIGSHIDLKGIKNGITAIFWPILITKCASEYCQAVETGNRLYLENQWIWWI